MHGSRVSQNRTFPPWHSTIEADDKHLFVARRTRAFASMAQTGARPTTTPRWSVADMSQPACVCREDEGPSGLRKRAAPRLHGQRSPRASLPSSSSYILRGEPRERRGADSPLSLADRVRLARRARKGRSPLSSSLRWLTITGNSRKREGAPTPSRLVLGPHGPAGTLDPAFRSSGCRHMHMSLGNITPTMRQRAAPLA